MLRQESSCTQCRGNAVMYDRSLLALARCDGKDFMPGFEGVVDEGSAASFRSSCFSPVCPRRFVCHCSRLALSDISDCLFPSRPIFFRSFYILYYSIFLCTVLLLSQHSVTHLSGQTREARLTPAHSCRPGQSSTSFTTLPKHFFCDQIYVRAFSSPLYSYFNIVIPHMIV